MGATTSINFSNNIHISISSKCYDYHNKLDLIIEKYKMKGINITKTDPSMSHNDICEVLYKTDTIIYCSTSCLTCPTQALEYSYLIDNEKKTVQLIINPYENKFTEYLQGFLNNEGIEIKNIEDIHDIILNMNKQIIC